jgi:hypothetical protein
LAGSENWLRCVDGMIQNSFQIDVAISNDLTPLPQLSVTLLGNRPNHPVDLFFNHLFLRQQNYARVFIKQISSARNSAYRCGFEPVRFGLPRQAPACESRQVAIAPISNRCRP